MQFHLVATSSGDWAWEVHKANCLDVHRAIRKRGINAVSIAYAETPEALIQKELADELTSMGYTKDDFRIMPCCKTSEDTHHSR